MLERTGGVGFANSAVQGQCRDPPLLWGDGREQESWALKSLLVPPHGVFFRCSAWQSGSHVDTHRYSH